MKNDTVFDPDVFEQADVRTRHLMHFMPVTRATVSQWLNRRQVPMPFIRTQLLEIQCAVIAALDDGNLPLPTSIPNGRHRDKRTIAAIDQYLYSLHRADKDGSEETTTA